MLYHAVSLQNWLAEPHRPYSAATLRTDGTVHCSASEEALLAVVSRFLRQVDGPLLALLIDETRLDAPVSWEAAVGAPSSAVLVPRIRGPVNRSAVVALREIERDGDGRARRLVAPPSEVSQGGEKPS